MSYIQISNQIKSLDTNNNVTLQKNNNINIKKDNISEYSIEDVSYSIPINNPMDFLEKEQSTTYTILSPVHESLKDIEYVDNNIDQQDYIDLFKNDELCESDIYSFNEPLDIINDSLDSDNLPIIMFENEITNIKDNNTYSSIEVTNNNFDLLMNPFEETYIVDATDSNFIKDNIFQQDGINDNSIIDSDMIITDAMIPNDQYIMVSDDMQSSINKNQENFNILKDTKILDQ
ncbi:MAG TPA: hypothetical protein VK482_01165 [Buchnera sp. (in: enterobacteria)]|nr:hypothetical protein [Buchnera sp. (in: enterobacteria)]